MKLSLPLVLTALALAGCNTPVGTRASGAGPGGATAAGSPAAQGRATAKLAPTSGNTASGTVQFVQTGGKVRLSGEVRGLKPNAEHGFHIHEKGDCSSPDATSAGGHFNPDGKPHGRPDAASHHAGDLPALKADASGVARVETESASFSVGPGAADIVGKALIVHRDPDDYTTQPTGNSGARIACAVIARG